MLKDRLSSSPVAVGDNVEISLEDNGQALIENVLPRKQFLARPDKLCPEKSQVIAANLDQLVIITSTREPKFKTGLVDRFLVSAEKEHLKAIIVINKIDLENEEIFRVNVGAWRAIGYEVIFTSAKTGQGLDTLRETLKDKSSALAGHSGVGKSSLINALQTGLNLKTGMISKASGKGVHTTTSVIMYPLDFGGWVIDTPGLKIFGFSGIDKTNLADYFPEISKLSGKCRFFNCCHISEPDCAVKKAVLTEKLSESRYQSYKKLWEQMDK